VINAGELVLGTTLKIPEPLAILIYLKLFQHTTLLYNQPIANIWRMKSLDLTLLVHDPLTDDIVNMHADTQHIYRMHCIMK
jgi:hypothetical protein